MWVVTFAKVIFTWSILTGVQFGGRLPDILHVAYWTFSVQSGLFHPIFCRFPIPLEVIILLDSRRPTVIPHQKSFLINGQITTLFLDSVPVMRIVLQRGLLTAYHQAAAHGVDTGHRGGDGERRQFSDTLVMLSNVLAALFQSWVLVSYVVLIIRIAITSGRAIGIKGTLRFPLGAKRNWVFTDQAFFF